MRNIAILLFIISALFSSKAIAQLPIFTLQVTSSNETCPGNGALTFTTTGTASGATIIFSIYKLPDVLTAISTQSTNTLTGLEAGTYTVIATQSVGNANNSQQQTVTIASTIQQLSFSVVPSVAICGNSTIQIVTLAGTASSYEIFAGPVTFPVQSSGTFANLPPGTYQIRVFDACGQGLTQSYTLQPVLYGLTIGNSQFPQASLTECDSILVQHSLSAQAGMVVGYPLTANYTIYPPSGGTILIQQAITSGLAQNSIPFFPGESYSYDLEIVDACGNVFTLDNNTVNRELSVSLSTPPMECSKALTISPQNFGSPFTINFTSAPAGFDPVQFNSQHPGPFSEAIVYYNTSVPIPNGLYIVEITDSCGRTATSQIVFNQNVATSPLSVNLYRGCDATSGSVSLAASGIALVSVLITSAPATYSAVLPDDQTSNIALNGRFYMNNLPPGSYLFQTVDECGNQRDTLVVVEGHLIASNAFDITENCSSFDLSFSHSSNLAQSESYWLQKFNPVTNEWGHPGTGYSNGLSPSAANARSVNNNLLNPNLAYAGLFRILKTFYIFSNGSNNLITCVSTIHEFEFTGFPSIDQVYSFACSPTSTDVIVVASGAGPLIFRITLKNGVPFVIENGSTNLFTNLEPAVYSFQVEDSCGNILNRIFDITEPLNMLVTASGFCNGQPASLSVPALPFLTYEWWKEGNPQSILSTANVLNFPVFTAPADNGNYFVRIVFPNTNSYIDIVLNYELQITGESPQVGTGSAVSLCTIPDTIDLFTMLSGAYDANGVWSESTGSAMIDGATWILPNVAGVYQFTYTVAGLCSTDSASVTITLNESVATPVILVAEPPCAGGNLSLGLAPMDGVAFQWNGPAGFSSNEQNPVLSNASPVMNGIYTVTANNGVCTSETASVEIQVTSLPNIVLSAACDGKMYTLSAAAETGILAENAVFTWNGPNGFSDIGNPINISGQDPGVYTVSITQGACFATGETFVLGTICDIPLGISPNDDGANDTFDLRGYDVDEIKIFNRYGMVVFEHLNYLDQWHGQDFNGNSLPSATYFYYMKLGSGAEKTGWVYLIRNH